MKCQFPIKLGSRVKDVVTGIEGTLSAISVESNGNLRGDIQPTTLDNKLIDAIVADVIQIELIGEGLSDKCPEPRDSSFEIDQVIRDKVNKVSGVVNRIAWHMNGCVIIRMKAFAEEKLTGGPKFVQLNEVEFEAVEPPATTKRENAQPPTGGPIERARRRD